MSKIMSSEACHFYTQEGEPAYKVKSADGKKMVKTTIVQARKKNLVPSVTTVMKIFAKDGVSEWLINIYLKCIQEKQITGCGMELYAFKELLKKYTEHERTKGRDEGTEIHRVVEEYLKGGKIAEITDNIKHQKIGMDVLAEIVKYSDKCMVFDCEGSHCNQKLGYGGAIDIRALTTDEFFIFDVKTTSEKQFDKLCKKPYTDWLTQLCAYEGFFAQEHRKVSLIVCRDTGRVGSYEWSDEKENKNYWNKWRYALEIYKINNKLGE